MNFVASIRWKIGFIEKMRLDIPRSENLGIDLRNHSDCRIEGVNCRLPVIWGLHLYTKVMTEPTFPVN